MKPALLTLLAFLATPAAAQTVQHVPDVDLTTALNPVLSVSSTIPTYHAYDADWTADGRLAFAIVHRTDTANWPSDVLFVGIHDPATGQSTLLGSLSGMQNWRFDHVSLAVPERFYDVEGTGNSDGTTPIHDLNKVYVALGAEAPVYTTWNGSTYTQRVRGVRLLNVSFTAPTPKLLLSAPANLQGKPVPPEAEGPHPELCVRGDAKGYVVDMVFVDPHNKVADGGHVMLASSFDKGSSLGLAAYITGPSSPAGASTTNPLRSSKYSRPVLGFDEQGKGTRLLALADIDRKVVHLASAPGNGLGFQVVVSTFSSNQGHFEPRIAVRKGQANVTYLVGPADAEYGRPLDWFSSSTGGGYLQHKRISATAQSAGDIEVRGNDAFIVVRQAPDQGVPGSVVMAYEASRTDALLAPVGTRVDDLEHGSELRPVSAVTPEYAQLAMVRTAVFRFVHKAVGTNNVSGLMRDDF